MSYQVEMGKEYEGWIRVHITVDIHSKREVAMEITEEGFSHTKGRSYIYTAENQKPTVLALEGG